MTVHFSAATTARGSIVASVFCTGVPLLPANDNHHGTGRDQLLHAALRHFAEHGLSAAERARDNAEQAFFEGDRKSYDQWMAICNALDRRMASAIRARHDMFESLKA